MARGPPAARQCPSLWPRSPALLPLSPFWASLTLRFAQAPFPLHMSFPPQTESLGPSPCSIMFSRGSLPPAPTQSQVLHSVSIRCSSTWGENQVLDPTGTPLPPQLSQLSPQPSRGFGPPNLPTAANLSYPAKAAGVSGDSPEGRRLGGRNALTSSPRAPARHCWSAARPGLRRMFSVPAQAARANRPLSPRANR